MNTQQIWAKVAAYLAGVLSTEKATLEADLAPVNVRVVNGALSVIETADAKLPFGLGALFNGALSVSAGADAAELGTLEGDGIDALIAALDKAGQVGSPPAAPAH